MTDVRMALTPLTGKDYGKSHYAETFGMTDVRMAMGGIDSKSGDWGPGRRPSGMMKLWISGWRM